MELYLSSRELNGQNGHEAGRELLSDLYRQATNQPLPTIAIADRGKPYFADNHLYFSISHARSHVFCALSHHPIGIDAEELDRNINLQLAQKILSPAEKTQFDAAADQRMALLTFWVLKEAQAKLTGHGLNGYPKHTNFSLDDPRVTIQDGCLLAVLQE